MTPIARVSTACGTGGGLAEQEGLGVVEKANRVRLGGREHARELRRKSSHRRVELADPVNRDTPRA